MYIAVFEVIHSNLQIDKNKRQIDSEQQAMP